MSIALGEDILREIHPLLHVNGVLDGHRTSNLIFNWTEEGLINMENVILTKYQVGDIEYGDCTKTYSDGKNKTTG